MKRENEFAVGVVVIVAFAVVVLGALWLSGAHLGKAEAIYTARFRTVGGLGVGTPVVLRGVRVGRVEAIRLASGNWVEADLKIYRGVTVPAKPAVIAASASLFGEWAATLVPQDQLPDDPNLRQAVTEASLGAGSKWPGATLPDIGQLTAQASRIATDIATVSSRVQSAFDSEAVVELRRSIRDFGQVAQRLVRVTNDQAAVLGNVGANLRQGSDLLAHAATDLSATLGRVGQPAGPHGRGAQEPGEPRPRARVGRHRDVADREPDRHARPARLRFDAVSRDRADDDPAAAAVVGHPGESPQVLHVQRLLKKCGMRNGECGIDRSASIPGGGLPCRRLLDLFRTPHSAFRISGMGGDVTRGQRRAERETSAGGVVFRRGTDGAVR